MSAGIKAMKSGFVYIVFGIFLNLDIMVFVSALLMKKQGLMRRTTSAGKLCAPTT